MKTPEAFLMMSTRYCMLWVGSKEKVELTAYQLKDVAQSWYTQWSDNRAFRVGSISWEVFGRDFCDRFFSRDKRESKLKEFINLYQGGMSVLE